MMTELKGRNLETTDRRLLRGLYLKSLKDFDEQLEDQSHNITLLSRLKRNLLNGSVFTDPSPRKRYGSQEDDES